jgi:hypothetical protein
MGNRRKHIHLVVRDGGHRFPVKYGKCDILALGSTNNSKINAMRCGLNGIKEMRKLKPAKTRACKKS